jgi:hypothetical protein
MPSERNTGKLGSVMVLKLRAGFSLSSVGFGKPKL